MLISFGALTAALLIVLASLCCRRRTSCECAADRRKRTAAAAAAAATSGIGGRPTTSRGPERGAALADVVPDSVGLPRLGGGVDGVRESFRSRHGLGLSVAAASSTPLHPLGVQTPHGGGRHVAPLAASMALLSGGGGGGGGAHLHGGSSSARSGTPTARDGLVAPTTTAHGAGGVAALSADAFSRPSRYDSRHKGTDNRNRGTESRN
jgi:hypothetical protein